MLAHRVPRHRSCSRPACRLRRGRICFVRSSSDAHALGGQPVDLVSPTYELRVVAGLEGWDLRTAFSMAHLLGVCFGDELMLGQLSAPRGVVPLDEGILASLGRTIFGVRLVMKVLLHHLLYSTNAATVIITTDDSAQAWVTNSSSTPSSSSSATTSATSSSATTGTTSSSASAGTTSTSTGSGGSQAAASSRTSSNRDAGTSSSGGSADEPWARAPLPPGRPHTPPPGRVVGLACVELLAMSHSLAQATGLPPRTPFALVCNLCVHPGHRRQGLGGSLLTAVDAVARTVFAPRPQATCMLVYKDNDAALRLYKGPGGFTQSPSWLDLQWQADAERGRLGRPRRLMLYKKLA